ncbi:MAG TPA: hypothetical protein VHW65_10100, partial [Gemmatimonadales bacterium]|nr:hypothetical protein [Gemmatimonadales bacterium]
ALRAHLIDMDDVIVHADVVQTRLPGGFAATVTGTGRVVGAIRRVAISHAKMLDATSEYAMTVTQIPGGVRVIAMGKSPADSASVARFRGLGFMGMLTEGDHHARHHLALARGDAMAHEH